MSTKKFLSGNVTLAGTTLNTENLCWNKHPTQKGVSIKHLIKGESTGNRVSCHLVKVEPGCEIAKHNHPGKEELHEVLEGCGSCQLEETRLDYTCGSIALLPADKDHAVKAGEKGLILMAKFFPALV
ncbi:cupin domain-containing protein [Marinilabiliaceae bacterium JC017]|nr:cupin domain-containing protein [Marinilabiliaceae bacterium JC017]